MFQVYFMLTQSESMWDGNLGLIEAEQLGIELDKTDSLPIHSAPYRAGPKTSDFDK